MIAEPRTWHNGRMMKANAILITGGGRGIGAAISLLCAKTGWDLVINYSQDREAAEAVAEQARAWGRQAWVVQADVSDEAQVLAMFAQIDAQSLRLAGLVNNAGVVAPLARLEDMSVARWQKLFGVNVIGSLLCAREAAKRMSTKHGGQGGVIVNMSSRAAALGSPGIYVDYAASKGAIDTLTLGLARELIGEGIRVNAVRPGLIDTEIHASGGMAHLLDEAVTGVPIRRMGTPDEVAQAVLWLLSEASSYTVGSFIDVGGGR